MGRGLVVNPDILTGNPPARSARLHRLCDGRDETDEDYG